MDNNIGPFDEGIVSRGADLMRNLMHEAQLSNGNKAPLNVTDDIPTLFKQYMDWARVNPTLVNKKTIELIFNMNNDIFKLFVPKIEKRSVHQWSVINMPPFLMDEMSRKAPARYIHKKAEHFVEHSVWTGIGFLLDYHFLETPDGPADAYRMNLYIASLTIAYFQMSCYRAFFNAVSYYQRPEQRVIGDCLPLDIYAAIRYSNQEYGIFAKSSGFVKNALVRYDQIFQQTSNTVGHLIVSSDFTDCIFGKSAQLVSGNSAGPTEAKANREGSDKVRQINNVRFITAPMTSRSVHDDKSEFVMFTETSKGSFWRFSLDYIDQTLPIEFNSELMNTVRAYSYETDRLDAYRFIDFLRHCPEFIPSTGAINYPLLKRFLVRSSPIDYTASFRPDGAGARQTRFKVSNAMNMFDKCKMNWSNDTFVNICNRMHMFINHLDRNNLHVATPVCCIGEIDEYHMPTDKLRYYGQNFTQRLFECLTAEEVYNFKRCIAEITKLNSGDMGPVIDLLHGQLQNDNRLFDDDEHNGTYIAIVALITAYDADNTRVRPVGCLTIPTMYELFTHGEVPEQIANLSFRYISILLKLIRHFDTLTDNHVASTINGVPSFFEIDPGDLLESNVLKKLIMFHHLLIFPQYQFYFFEHNFGGAHDHFRRILPLVLMDDKVMIVNHLNSRFTYDGTLNYNRNNAPDRLNIENSILGGGERMRRVYDAVAMESIDENKAPIDKLIDMRKRYFDDEENIDNKIHPAVLQHALFNLGKNRFFNDRWSESFMMETTDAIGFRALLLDMVNLREFERQTAVNRAIPFSGTVLRGDELQRTMSMPVVANGDVGTFFYDDKYKFISFDQGTQQYTIMTYAQFAPIVTDNQKFFIAEHAWGGEPLGGKGRHYINEDTDVTPDNEQRWSDITSKIGYGDRLGFFCNVPVLQSLRSGLVKIYHTALDRRGWFNIDDFIGLYEQEDGFAPRDDVMYDNCLFANFIYRFPTISFPRNQTNMYSFQDKASRCRVNNICCETTTIVYDHFSKTKTREIKSSHAWGDQKAGSIKRETGIIGPYYMNDETKDKHEDSIQRKRKLHDITDSDYHIIFQ